MQNLVVAIKVLEKHREARNWTDAAVAVELLTQLGLDPDAEAAHTTMQGEDEAIPTKDEVMAAELAAQDAMDHWTTLREQRQGYERRRREAAAAGANAGASVGPLLNEQPIGDFTRGVTLAAAAEQGRRGEDGQRKNPDPDYPGVGEQRGDTNLADDPPIEDQQQAEHTEAEAHQ